MTELRADLVALVLEVLVRPGDDVAGGDALVILESMKMEIPVLAEGPGRVQGVHVAVGDVVQEGDLIAVLS